MKSYWHGRWHRYAAVLMRQISPIPPSVISSTPIYERISRPKRECWTEQLQVAPREQPSIGRALVGGVAGGLLGSQVGGSSGNTAATGAGAVAGAVVGDRVDNPDGNHSATGAIIGGSSGRGARQPDRRRHEQRPRHGRRHHQLARWWAIVSPIG